MSESTELSGQNVLVTGASGFIGSALSRKLSALGANVVGLCRSPAGAKNQDIEWRYSNLEAIDEVRQILDDVQPGFIFHLASHVAGARELELVLPTFTSNLSTTVNLLTAAAGRGCKKIVLTGSLEESVGADGVYPVPSSPYAAAKMASSAYGRMFHALYQEPVVIMRLFMVYGPNQRDIRKLVPYTALSLLRGEAPKCSAGTRMVDWVYVDDVVDGFISAALSNRADGETIDIGSGELRPIKEIVEALVDIVNPDIRPEFSSSLNRALEQVRVADVDKTCQLTGWKPNTDLKHGLTEAVSWYRDNASLYKT